MQNKLISLGNKNYIEFKRYKSKNSKELDTLKIKTDYVLLFSANLFNPLKNEYDKFAVLNGGLRVKQSFDNALKLGGYAVRYDCDYVVDGENLPCNKLCKIVVKSEEAIDENMLMACKEFSNKLEYGSNLVVDLTIFKNKKTVKEIETILKNNLKNKKIKYILIKNK